MKMKMSSMGKRLLALLMCLCLLVGYMPAMFTHTRAADISLQDIKDKTVDAPTIHNWKQYFDIMSTEFTGGVWTDKSVFQSFADYQAAAGVNNFLSPANNALTDEVKQMLATDPENFLIALSAISANQSISGSASYPMDTMLVLDVSGSMQGSNATAMVQATNRAIETLLSMNVNNRIGVVLYSGNSVTGNSNTSTASVLLPLGRYTTTNTQTIGQGNNTQRIPAYLTISGSGDNQKVSVASSVNNGNSTDSKNVVGGTYIQNGLYQAWRQFSAVTDTKVPEGNVQSGAQRQPILILMSDGAPTAGTTAYNNVQSSNRGNGSATNNEIGFLTQLTASWVRGKVQEKYGVVPKFYSLGIGTGNDSIATSVLNPAGSNDTLDGYWTNFFNNRPNSDGNVEIVKSVPGQQGHWVSVPWGEPGWPGYWQEGTEAVNGWSVYKDSAVTTQNYIDQYWLANNADGLISAFSQIVEKIVLEAEQYATLINEKGGELSGYVTFEDELGELMEVKDIKGLAIGNKIFTGAELAKSFNTGELGTIDIPTAYGDELIRTVKERLGIADTSVAQQLVARAYNAGQLSYTSATEYSNYIGWYADDNGNYKGFWQESDGYDAANAPEDATYINKSYGFLGAPSSEEGASDMMHVVVMVHTEIATGRQSVVYKIPAALIPTVTYNIELEGSDITKPKSMTRDGDEPLQLLFEVGLRSDINSLNIAQKVAEYDALEDTHIHVNDDGTYTFYTNRWGSGDGSHDVDYDEPLTHLVAESHFNPALENSRYYHVINDTVYTDQNGTVYTGNAAPTGEKYFARPYYEVVGGTARYTVKYAPINASVLDQAKRDAGTNTWYIPEGTPHSLARFALDKDLDNPTDTLDYSWNPVILHDSEGYHSYTFLGNNGKFTVAPAQGIALSKAVTETVEGAPTEFTFEITLSQAVATPLITDADGNVLPNIAEVDGNVITVKITDGQTVYITGIPTGTRYTVEEVADDYYTATSTNASGTIAAYTVNKVDFTNTPKGYGDLIVSKDVSHPFEVVPTALTEKQFTIQVQLSGEGVANEEFSVIGLTGVTSVTTDANGKFTLLLRDGESATIQKLPENTTYTATEILDANTHKGFSLDTVNSVMQGEVKKNETALVQVVNIYAPSEPVASVSVTGTKTVTDPGDTFDWTGKSFSFKLEQYDPESGTYTQIGEVQTVTQQGGTYTFTDALTLNAIGTYYYKVSEIIPEADDRLEGMSYDATAGRFVVHVTDNDVDGTLEFEILDYTTGEEINGSNNVFTFTKNFVNTHNTDATFVEFSIDKNVTPANLNLSGAGYLFGLYEVNGGVTATTPAYTMRTVGVEGTATFHIPLTQTGETTYILKEIHPAEADKLPGMVYTDQEYTVVVKAEAAEGKLVPSVSFKNGSTDITENDLVFVNEMNLTPTSIQWQVNKVMEGITPATPETFTFTLTETDGSFVTPKTGGITDTVNITGAGNELFDSIAYTGIGTHYYVIRETAGTRQGMTYDPAVYHITVNVTANGNLLEAAAVIRKLGVGTVDAITFTNTYNITGSVQADIAGVKNLDGREQIAGEFTFELYEGSDLKQTVTNATNGNFAFAPIIYTAADIGTHTYKVVEKLPAEARGNVYQGVTYDRTEYEVVVIVSDNGQGGLNIAKTVNGNSDTSIVFNNTYAAEKTDPVILRGLKQLYNTDKEENADLTDIQFTFELYASDPNFSTQGALIGTTENAADGSFSFTQEYTQAGDYFYILREKIGTEETLSYDTARYLIRVLVTDDGEGKLHAMISYFKEGVGSVDSVLFTNIYTPVPAEAGIGGTKKLENRDIQDGEFTFELYDANGELLESVTNTGEGFAFTPVIYLKSGTYTYKVVEKIPEKAVDGVYKGVTYDTKEYEVTVTVTDENGALKAAISHTPAQLVFTNTYTQPTAKLDLTIQKKMEILSGDKDMGVEGYKFNITDEKGKVVTTLTSDKDGNAAYTLSFTDADIGKTFKYEITEVDTGVKNVTYSTAKYRVAITVGETEDGSLDVTAFVNDKSVEAVKAVFTNTYKEPARKPPATHQTGDDTNLVFYAMAMALSLLGFATVVIVSKKQRHAK